MSFKRLLRNQLFWLGVITVVAFAVRAWRISEPAQQIFDEVYYPRYAREYLSGGTPFDAHPPAGRLIITAGAYLLGDRPLGWRVMPLVFGTMLVPLAYFLTIKLFGDRRAGLIAALLVTADGMLIVYSRTGLIDIFLAFFILLALTLALLGLKPPKRLPGWLFWLGSGAALGIATSVKWVGIGIAPILLVLAATTLKKRTLPKQIATLGATLIAVPVIVYGLIFILEPGHQPVIWQDIKGWHTHTWRYHINLTETRTYNSRPYDWPLLTKPIHFFNETKNNQRTAIVSLGNPLIWWGSTLAVAAALGWLLLRVLKRRLPTLPSGVLVTLTSYLVLILPWTFVNRGLFIFHYLPSLLFAILLLSYWLSKLFNNPKGRLLAVAYLVAVALLTIYHYPILTAKPLPQNTVDQRLWFQSWRTN